MANREHVDIGIIGCGDITREFKLFFKLIKNAKFVAAADTDYKKARKIAGKECAYSDVNEMFDKEDFDVLYIATPHYLHRDHIKLAFEHGKHVFCEKPVGISVEDARAIYHLDKKYPHLKLGFNYQYRYDPKCFELSSGIKDGILGDIYYANCNVYFSRDSTYYNDTDWRMTTKFAGGGTLLTQASHIIDIMIWTLGEPKSVIGKVKTAKFKDIETEDLGLGIVEFESGVLAQINSSMIVEPPFESTKGIVELLIFGNLGRVSYKGPLPSVLNWYGIRNYSPQKTKVYSPYIAGSLEAFADWILNDIPYLNTIEESSKVLRLISALYNSSKTEKKELVEKLF